MALEVEGPSVMYITLKVKPQPNRETRFNRSTGTAYKDREAKKYAAALAAAIEETLEGQEAWMYQEGFLAVRINLQEEQISINVEKNFPPFIKIKGDVDNYAKPILDAANGRIWQDDNQIVRLEIAKW